MAEQGKGGDGKIDLAELAKIVKETGAKENKKALRGFLESKPVSKPGNSHTPKKS